MQVAHGTEVHRALPRASVRPPCTRHRHLRRGRGRGARDLLLLALTACGPTACGPSVTLDAPRPTATSEATALALPTQPVSIVDAPIALDLGSALGALESAVPTRFGNLQQRLRNPGNGRQHFAYEATRQPFRVALEDERVTISTLVSYAGRGWYKPPLLPELSAACGESGPRPRVRARLQTDLELSPDWQLRTRTRLAGLAPATDTPRDACTVTAFDIDVTDKVVDGVRGVLRRQLPRIDRQLARWDVRSRLTQWYGALDRPIPVHDSLWLLLQPTGVRYGGLSTTDSAVVVVVRLFARPTLVTGARPVREAVVLPPFTEAATVVGDSARIFLDAQLGYDVLRPLVRRGLVGRTFTRWQRRVRIDDARLEPVGDGRLALGLRFSGAVDGEGWLVGTPVLDTMRGTLTVPDLDFDVATGDLLVRGLQFLRGTSVLDVLRAQATVSLDELLDPLRERVQRAMNRELAEGVHLVAALSSARAVAVSAGPDALHARAETRGRLALEIDRTLTGR